MSKAFFTKDEIEQARKVDLLTYMRVKEPENLKKICNGNYTTAEHSSLKISNGLWCWHSKKDEKTGKKIGGKNALDYLTKVKNLSFLIFYCIKIKLLSKISTFETLKIITKRK